MTEDQIPVTGLPGTATGFISDEDWSILYPTRNATIEKFGRDAVEQAAKIAMFDSLQWNMEVVEDQLLQVEWSEYLLSDEEISICRIAAKVRKRKTHAPE